MTLCEFVAENGRYTCARCGLVAPAKSARAICRIERKQAAAAVVANAGPGAELKRLLATIGIKATEGCSCNSRAAVMDARGPDWCEQNLEEIVGWLREEAEKRKLPFLDMAGRVLVRRAIANARRKATV